VLCTIVAPSPLLAACFEQSWCAGLYQLAACLLVGRYMCCVGILCSCCSCSGSKLRLVCWARLLMRQAYDVCVIGAACVYWMKRDWKRDWKLYSAAASGCMHNCWPCLVLVAYAALVHRRQQEAMLNVGAVVQRTALVCKQFPLEYRRCMCGPAAE